MSTVQIAITKAKGKFVEFDTDDIPEDVYAYALKLGLKQLVNRGTSKLVKGDEAGAVELAKRQVEAIKTGKVRMVGGERSKVAGVVKTEAMRLARNAIKDEIKRQGYKISSYEAKEITEAAKTLLEQDPSLYETAEANLKARQEAKPKIELGKMIDLSKAETSRAPKKGEKPALSAKQAGMVAARAKPQPTHVVRQ